MIKCKACSTELKYNKNNKTFYCKQCNRSFDMYMEIIAIGEVVHCYGNTTSKTSRPTLINCSACGKQISNQAPACPNCGQPTGVHVCPKCGSADTKVISGASKAVSVVLWGVFAANKVMAKYVCNKCSHKF